MIALPAQLTLREAQAALRTLLPAIEASSESPVTLDAAPLQDIDSAVLAVLLECKRQAQRRQGDIRVVNVPARLDKLARLYGVTEVLGFAEA